MLTTQHKTVNDLTVTAYCLISEEKKPEVRLISRSQPSPREALHSAPKQTTPKQTPPSKPHIPFLKTPEDEEPMKPQRSRFKDERSESREVPTETRRSSNPINRPIDGAPTRRPKVPKVLYTVKLVA